jgi:hypothetical protein
VVRCVSWDGPGPVASGVSMHGVESTLWGCVSWGYPGPVTPINVMGHRSVVEPLCNGLRQRVVMVGVVVWAKSHL